MAYSLTYKSPRPSLLVECIGGRSLGRCYSEATHRVTAQQAIPVKKLRSLFEAGVVGIGQEVEFYLIGPDGKRTAPSDYAQPSGHDYEIGRAHV